ncbi:ATP-binding cassette domain-containing protein [Methanogenium sp. S4BF]|uniref:ABC transporter ATP-binding protein n=1 Tax=Methanogenium sp. S4BF TaxID=1789226 RepID=UPI002416090F|nr:ATP-binding cassette domain-containing protein [Methanogenium sp. S4BF]WFN34260.1 ATP-binding cassette domain-containing protein [Methanogenium sp. S4BF]
MIEFENVSVTLGDFRLNEVSIRVESGDYYFIIGPSGAGKTIILEAMAGLHHPNSGRVLIDGEDVSRVPPEKRKVALVYQDYSLFPHMTVYDNIAFGLKLQKLPKAEVERRVVAVISRFGIAHLRNRAPYTMSGGEQQRVALARALVTEPDILLLDEPLSAMDQVNRDKFVADLRAIHKEHNLTIVHVTHSREEALSLATRVAVIIDGTLEQEGERDEVFRKPPNRRVGRFVGIENVFEGMVAGTGAGGSVIRIDGCSIRTTDPVPEGCRVCVFIRAADVAVRRAGIPADDEYNCFPATVEEIIPRESYYLLKIACGISLYSLASEQEIKEKDLAPGQAVSVSFSPASVHVTRDEVQSPLLDL